MRKLGRGFLPLEEGRPPDSPNKFFLIRYFRGWNVFEIALLAASIVVPLAVGLAFHSTTLEIVAATSTILVGILLSKAKVEASVLALGASVLYAIVAWHQNLFGEVFVELGLTIPIMTLGIVGWVRNRRCDKKLGNVVKISSTKLTELLVISVAQLGLSVGYFFILLAFGTAFPVISTLAVATAIFGTYFVARRSAWGMVGFIANDIAQIALWTLVVVSGDTAAAVMITFPALLLINDTYGIWSWQRIQTRQMRANKKLNNPTKQKRTRHKRRKKHRHAALADPEYVEVGEELEVIFPALEEELEEHGLETVSQEEEEEINLS